MADALLAIGDHPDTRSDRLIATIVIGPTTWRVRSFCGVVQMWSSRDGCLAAMNPAEAHAIGTEIAEALTLAAYSVTNATAGGDR